MLVLDPPRSHRMELLTNGGKKFNLGVVIPLGKGGLWPLQFFPGMWSPTRLKKKNHFQKALEKQIHAEKLRKSEWNLWLKRKFPVTTSYKDPRRAASHTDGDKDAEC